MCRHNIEYIYQSPSPSSHIRIGETLLFPILRAEFRNQATLFDEILIELLDTDKVLKG